MAMEDKDISFTNNEAIHNFELIVDKQRAFIDYQLKGDKIYLVHTQVPVDLRDQGIAAIIVEKALQYIDEHHLKLVPLCPYVQQYLKRHPQWDRLLA